MIKDVKYNKDGLIAAIAQDAVSGEILMQAYMNSQALELSVKTGYATYFSRSRNKLWKKGEQSGEVQKIVSMYFDCDKDCVLLKVIQTGNACHTGAHNCFFDKIKEFSGEKGLDMLSMLEKTIKDRMDNPEEGSYTSALFKKGTDKIAKKVAEEAAETIIAFKNGNKQEIIMESCDLIYHLMVLLAKSGVSLADLMTELDKRHK